MSRDLVSESTREWPNASKIGLLVDQQVLAYEVYKRRGFVEPERLAPMVMTR